MIANNNVTSMVARRPSMGRRCSRSGTTATSKCHPCSPATVDGPSLFAIGHDRDIDVPSLFAGIVRRPPVQAISFGTPMVFLALRETSRLPGPTNALPAKMGP